MVTMAQRIEQLRDEMGLSRPALAAALKLPKQAVEKFETGRQSPTKEQTQALADFFGVSVFYLKGESNDRTRQDAWLDAAYSTPQGEHIPIPAKVAKPKAQPQTNLDSQGNIFESFLRSKQFQDSLRTAVLDVLRSPEGQDIIARAVRTELNKQR